MPEEVCEDESVKTAIGVITECDEGRVAMQYIPLSKHRGRGGIHVILHPQLTEHTMRKIRSMEAGIAVIQGIGPIDREQMHGTTSQGITHRSAKERRGLLQLLQSK